jgi:hypothetical protein
MVTVSLAGRGGIEQAEAYRLTPLKAFEGKATTYGQRTGKAEDAESARNDPRGFYHGITVKHGKEQFVLTGPPIVFVPEPVRPEGAARTDPEQLSLF